MTTGKPRRLWCGLLAALCLAAGLRATAAVGGGTEVASLSYLQKTFLPALEKGIGERVKGGTQGVYDAALARVDKLGGQYSAGKGGEQAAWTVSDTPQPTVLSGGDTVTLDEGGSFLWLAGSGAAGSGLVDATDGAEIPAGGPLRVGHRYLNGLEGAAVQVAIRSDKAQAAPAGRWTLASGNRDVTPFYDLCQSDWFYAGARWAYDSGIFKGVSDTAFSPNETVNRAMMATILHRLEGGNAAEYAGSFSDVPAKQWYTAGVEWAAGTGIVGGNGDGTFSPLRPATREQIAVMLYRYGQYLGRDMSAAGATDSFHDGASVSTWAKEAVAWAVGAGLLKGADGYLMPQQSATRAEVASLIQRFQIWAGQA